MRINIRTTKIEIPNVAYGISKAGKSHGTVKCGCCFEAMSDGARSNRSGFCGPQNPNIAMTHKKLTQRLTQNVIVLFKKRGLLFNAM